MESRGMGLRAAYGQWPGVRVGRRYVWKPDAIWVAALALILASWMALSFFFLLFVRLGAPIVVVGGCAQRAYERAFVPAAIVVGLLLAGWLVPVGSCTQPFVTDAIRPEVDPETVTFPVTLWDLVLHGPWWPVEETIGGPSPHATCSSGLVALSLAWLGAVMGALGIRVLARDASPSTSSPTSPV